MQTNFKFERDAKMAKKKLTKGTTPVGEVLFAHLQKPEEYQGKSTNKFTVMLKLNEADKAALLAKIDAEWEKFKQSDEMKGKKCKYEYANGLKETKDGDEYFKFKMTHILEWKGEKIEKHVPIYDADCKEISKTCTGIGNGSKAKVAYELNPFYMNDKNYGVALRLVGIQILDLVEFGSVSASAMGFESEDGYSAAEEENRTDDDVPFDTDADDTEEDF